MSSFVMSKYKAGFRLLRKLEISHKSVSHASTSTFMKQVVVSNDMNKLKLPEQADDSQAPINKAARAYLNVVDQHDRFMSERVAEFQIGRRHLANMMGVDPSTFSQQDIDNAIAYLLPSGLSEKTSHPKMEHPENVFRNKNVAQFDHTGRPFHSLFYTAHQHYYQIMHDITGKMKELDKYEDERIRKGSPVEVVEKLKLYGSDWLSAPQLAERCQTTLRKDDTIDMYNTFIVAISRLCAHPYSYRIQDFIMGFRTPVASFEFDQLSDMPEVNTGPDGRRFVLAQGTRKTGKAIVKVIEEGTGQIAINNTSLLYFHNPQEREQVLLPLLVSGLLNKVDVVAKVEKGGVTGQSGALRYALSIALQPFIDHQTRQKMKLAGLLMQDVRRKERNKPGRVGPRAKPTWKKR